MGLLAVTLLSSWCHAAQPIAQIYTLEQLFEIAEKKSSQLKPVFSAEAEARRGVDEARAKRLPDIEAALSFSYLGDGFTTERNLSDYQKAPIPHYGNALSLSVNQPVYTGGAITAGIDLAKLKLTASRYAAELRRNDLRFQLTGFYLDIYKYSNLREVLEHNLAQARKVLVEMNHRFQEGMALRNDITRYELLVSNLELELIRINNTVNILNDNLVTIAGLPEQTVVEPDTAILMRSLPDADADLWIKDALSNSPSVKLARNGVEISRQAEKLAKSEMLPKIGLQAGWNIDGPILVEVPPINCNLSYWYVGVGVSYSLSSLFKANKSVARSREAILNASDCLEATIENTSLGVRSDYVKYLEAYEELKTQSKSVELARQNYAVTATRYGSDMALITDMLDAANSKLDAEQQLVNARINIIYYYYKLLFRSGKI
ncbi:MAG: TolC family protein [Paramuribaculum sp.]|nr:TolC family protein [Paramuribaculum sp.]MDE6303509.1 TolC family protein [Paramuribaculum sp.]